MTRRTLLAGIAAATAVALVPAKALAGLRSPYVVPRFSPPAYCSDSLRVTVYDERGPVEIDLAPRRTTWVALVAMKHGAVWLTTMDADDLRGWRRIDVYERFTTGAHGVVGFTALYRA